MNLNELKQSDLVIFRIIAGSVAYGLNTPTSDVDERGIYIAPLTTRLGITDSDQQIANESQDIVYYDIHKYFKLAIDCNPNIIEFLWTPKDCIQFMDKEGRMQRILDNRALFVSAKAYHTFSGYAYAQIKKCRGQNKLVHNPKPKDPPKKEDFCWVVLGSKFKGAEDYAPCRPIPLKELCLDLAEHHVAALEHVNNTYRLYYYGKESKGVFRGNDMLVCESIPLEDERDRFVGILIYNQHEYDKALKEWHQYWDWVNNRNDARWEHQEAGKIDYDCYLESDTMFMTRRGWVKYADVKEGEAIGTVNPLTHSFEWQVPTARRSSSYSGPVYIFENRYTKFAVTPNHNLYVSDSHRSPINGYSTGYNSTISHWHLETVDQYWAGRRSYKHIRVACENDKSDNNITDDCLKLIGLYLSEGSIGFGKLGSHQYISLSQLEGGRAQAIWKSTAYNWSISKHYRKGRIELTCNLNNRKLAKWLANLFGTGCTKKTIPVSFWSKLSTRQVGVLFDAMMAGDGHRHPKGHSVYYTSSARLANDIQMMWLANGRAVQVYGPYEYTDKASPMFHVFMPKSAKTMTAITKTIGRPQSGWSQLNVCETDICCFTVPNGLLITKNGSKTAIQGNSKNMMHCLRLLFSGKNILQTGEPIVRFEGEQKDYLMQVRSGIFKYEDIMTRVDKEMAELEVLKTTTKLPWGANVSRVNMLYYDIVTKS